MRRHSEARLLIDSRCPLTEFRRLIRRREEAIQRVLPHFQIEHPDIIQGIRRSQRIANPAFPLLRRACRSEFRVPRMA